MKVFSIKSVLIFLLSTLFWGEIHVVTTNSNIQTVEARYSEKEIFVSPLGNDSNSGTRDAPYFTIQKAIEGLSSGTTITLLEGIYELKSSVVLNCRGAQNAWIIFRGDKNANVILDGANYNIDNTKGYPSNKGLIQIENAEYVRIQNIYVRNSHRSGINIQESRHVDIINCTSENSLSPGIAAWQRCEYIRVLGNTVINASDREMSWEPFTGSEAPHEAISMAGPHYFEVAYNHVYNCKKEGIDVKETASHGKVHHNYVHDCARQGLYIDGWFGQLEDIEMYQNVVHGCEAGIAVSSEEGPDTKDLKIHHNLVFNNRATGIFFSRWGANNPRENITVNNNTFYRNGWGPNFSGDPQYWLNGGCYLYSTNIKNVIIRNNIFAFNFPFEIGITSLMNEKLMKEKGIVINQNLIYDENKFSYPIYLKTWAKDSVYSITGTNPFLTKPNFEDPANGDFRLKDDSQILILNNKEKDGSDNYLGAFPPGASTDEFWWKRSFPPEITEEELK